jgi:hypothetical protein
MFLVHICSSRYAKPFKANNKHCKIFPFENTKSAFAFAEWFLIHGPPVCVRVEKMDDELDEDLLLLARDNSDVILLSLENDGKPEEDDINDCEFVC